ncbi:protein DETOXIFICATION 49 [Morus notabilis]|uniref:protein DETOXIFICATION 49 n=1 Tax=Morus notabilis TaxID=981085 RepID=UPI000CED0769|nr:protein DETOXIFICATION 49 [Morus notabilis]
MHENNYVIIQSSTPLLSHEYDTKEDIIHDDIIEQQPYSKRFARENFSKALKEIKQLYMIAVPMILTGLLMYGKSAISMFFMGKMGKSALAGGSLAISIANISGYSVLSGLASGMEGISSQAFGARQWRLMGQTLNRTVLILLLASFPISLIWLKSHLFFLYWCKNPVVAATATIYLTFSIPSLIFQSFINPLKIYLRTQKITKPLMISAVIALAVHVPINYYLVYHHNLGIRAIAMAATLTDVIILVVLAAYLAFSGVCKRSWPGWSLECFTEWKPILCQSIPSCISVCLEWWWYELMIILSGLLYNAEEAVACMGILIQATSLIYQFPHSMNQAASTRVGNELGANQPNKAKTASLVALWCGMLTGIGAMAFMVGMKDLWGRIFTADKDILALAAATLPVVGLCELGNCPQTTTCGVLKGSARPTLAAFINLITFYGVGLPVAMLVGFKMGEGLVGLWYGLFAAQIVCLLVMIVVLITTDWKKQAERAQELTGSTNNAENNNINTNEEQISISTNENVEVLV